MGIISLYIFLCLLYFLVYQIGWNILEGDKHTRFIVAMVKLSQFNILILLYFYVENWAYYKAKRKLYYYQEGSVLTLEDVERWGIKEEDVRVDSTGEVVNWHLRRRNKYKVVFGRGMK